MIDRSRWNVQYMQRVLATDPMVCCMMDEKQGTVSYDMVTARSDGAQNGAYTAIALGQPGIGDGRTSAFFDGATSFNDVGTVPLLAAFPGPEGSMMLWALPDPASFNDAVLTRLFAANDAPSNNYLFLAHTGVNANLQFDYRAGGVAEVGGIVLVAQPTVFQCALITWSAVNDRVRYYNNGATASPEDNGLGAWGAQPIRAVIGASTVVPANPYFGLLAQWVLWSRELTPATAADLAMVE